MLKQGIKWCVQTTYMNLETQNRINSKIEIVIKNQVC